MTFLYNTDALELDIPEAIPPAADVGGVDNFAGAGILFSPLEFDEEVRTLRFDSRPALTAYTPCTDHAEYCTGVRNNRAVRRIYLTFGRCAPTSLTECKG